MEDDEDAVERIGEHYIDDLVYGANDGVVTTFAAMSAVAGAALEPFVILLIGIANIASDGFSLAAGDYLATTSEHQYREKRVNDVQRLLREDPESAEEKLRTLYKKRGLTGDELDDLVETITDNEAAWQSTLLMDDHLVDEDLNPFEAGLANFTAFLTAGTTPLIPYIFTLEPMFTVSAAITGVTLFIVGSLRSLVTDRTWLRSGVEMLFIGALAAAVAYLIGWYVQTLH